MLRNGFEGDLVQSVATINTGAWYHVAGVFDPAGSQLRIYVNGFLDNSKTTSFTPGTGTGSTRIGARGDDASFKFNGLIDETRVTASAVYTTSFTPQAHLVAVSGTRGLWKFDSQNANDTSGNGNNGTLIGGATFSTDVPQ